jgi:CRP-like cAMP-binding protein
LEIVQAIESSYLAQGLSRSDIDQLAKLASVRSYDAGVPIIKQFDRDMDLMILVDGEATILSVIGKPVGTIKPGVPFGEMSLIDEGPRSATVVSHLPCQVAVIGIDDLRELFKQRQDIALTMVMNIGKALSQRLRSMNRQVAAFMALEELHGYG